MPDQAPSPKLTPTLGDDLDERQVQELSVTADLLVAHGRRENAIALIASALGELPGHRGLVLLARIQIESGTKEGALAAVGTLKLCRCSNEWDLEAIVLLRDAFELLGRTSSAWRLDRAVRWTGCGGVAFPKKARGAGEPA